LRRWARAIFSNTTSSFGPLAEENSTVPMPKIPSHPSSRTLMALDPPVRDDEIDAGAVDQDSGHDEDSDSDGREKNPGIPGAKEPAACHAGPCGQQ
jgi:hypothetical protein